VDCGGSMTDYELREIEYAASAGLSAPAAEHKQFYLDKILKLAAGPEGYARWKEDLEWEDGIPA